MRKVYKIDVKATRASTFLSCSADLIAFAVQHRIAIMLNHTGFFHFVNVYFRFRHASITNGAFVAESGRSIHGSSSSVLGEAAQHRIEGRYRLVEHQLASRSRAFQDSKQLHIFCKHG